MMNVKMVGKELKVTEAIEAYVTEKMKRIEKYFEEDMEVAVTIKAQREEQIASIVVKVTGATFIAETSHKDLYASIDKDIDILEGQIRKWKTKKEKQTKEESIKQKEMQKEIGNVVEIANDIVKTIYYDIKPMTPEDAKLKLQESKTNEFMIFVNIDTGKANVIYRLKDRKNYGIIEPEA